MALSRHTLRALRSCAAYYGLRVLGGARVLRDAAVTIEVLSPAESTTVTPVRMPEGHIERVSGGAVPGEAPAVIIKRLRATVQEHAPTESITIRDAVVWGRNLFGGGTKHDLYRSDPVRLRDMESLHDVTLAATYAGTRWWGHFIHDDLPQELLATSLQTSVITHARPTFADEPGYRDVFRIAKPRVVPAVIADRCTLLVDYSQNASKRSRYATMRAQVPRAVGDATRVYVRRMGGAKRHLHGEDELVDALAQRGYVIMTNADAVGKLVNVCTRAVQLVAIDGSHIAPLMFLMREGAELVTIIPTARVSTVLSDVARANNLRAAMFVCDGPDTDMQLDRDVFLRFLDA